MLGGGWWAVDIGWQAGDSSRGRGRHGWVEDDRGGRRSKGHASLLGGRDASLAVVPIFAESVFASGQVTLVLPNF